MRKLIGADFQRIDNVSVERQALKSGSFYENMNHNAQSHRNVSRFLEFK